jgi:two-component system OmpR family response regulator
MPKVLLVEDEPLLNESYRITLEVAGFDVDTAMDGKEALRFCSSNTYDVILLDLMMPGLDGIGFLERFTAKSKPSKTKTKIIILSNLSSGGKVDQVLKLGAYKYLEKSALDPKQLIEILKAETGA